MYAIVEFLNTDNESNGEVSIVPLIWVYKNESRCYWPVRTNKIPFSDFVKGLSPFKKSWPTYKIKLLYKTASYTIAETKLQKIVNDVPDSSESCRSLIQKQLECLDSSGTDLDEVDENRDENNSPTIKRSKVLEKIQEQEQDTASTSSRSTIISRISRDSESGPSSIRVRSEFEDIVLEKLSKLVENVEQHSIQLNEMVRYSRSVATDKLIAPNNVPAFPIKDLNAFNNFNTILQTDIPLREYMVKRLAALGGSGICNLTRRCLKYIMNNELAVLFNWKGRDKIAFEKTQVMDLIYAATKVNYTAAECDELKVANAVKDWLKFAKLRLKSIKK